LAENKQRKKRKEVSKKKMIWNQKNRSSWFEIKIMVRLICHQPGLTRVVFVWSVWSVCGLWSARIPPDSGSLVNYSRLILAFCEQFYRCLSVSTPFSNFSNFNKQCVECC
jgi:hypothetical protein